MVHARIRPSSETSLFDRLWWLPASGMLLVPAIVAPSIVWARIAWLARHPDVDPNSTYLTISHAIADPAIGHPFAAWITLAALILWPSTHLMAWMFLSQLPDRAELGATRDRLSRATLVGFSAAMTTTCVGMVVLANHRLGGAGGDHAMHMIGSYAFFVGQSVAIFMDALHHSLIAPARRSEPDRSRFTSGLRRARIGYFITLSAVFFGVLYEVKSLDLGPARPFVVAVYVEMETILILAFLTYMALYFVDVARFCRTWRGRAETDPADESAATT